MISGAYVGWGIGTGATRTVRSVLPSGAAAWVVIRALIKREEHHCGSLFITASGYVAAQRVFRRYSGAVLRWAWR